MDIPQSFQDQVVEIVKTIPYGKVMSYGQIASRLGTQDARAIGYSLHGTGSIKGFPWWRVLNNEGKITIKDEAGRNKQKELLMAEGVYVNEDFILDIEKYRYGIVPGQKRLL